jgi:hypothetical protein
MFQSNLVLGKNMHKINKDKLLVDLFVAYYDARKNKRSKHSVLEYELNYESNLIKLRDSLLDGSYKISKSICFISNYPVKREIFAASFEDRIIHHLIFNYINPIFDNLFINDSYSCRKNKGTSYGIQRLNKFIRSASYNYTKDTYILKLDIKGYFMSINKHILFKQIKKTLTRYKEKLQCSFEWVLNLIQLVLFHNPIKNVVFKSPKSEWGNLPKDKSLFYAKQNTGLPIGNLTSQLFGNIYLDSLDKYIKYELGFKYYGRYVDDFFIIDDDKNTLKNSIEKIQKFLLQNLNLILHPKKIYLQYFKNGVAFLGVFVKPYRIYPNKRIKGNFYKTKTQQKDFALFFMQINSYLGLMNKFNSYKLRKKILFSNNNFNGNYVVDYRLNRIIVTNKGRKYV